MLNSLISSLNARRYVLAIILVIIIFSIVIVIIRHRKTKSLKSYDFQKQWQDVEQFCLKNETWPLAVITADKLLDDALKRCRFRGRTMGERLVSAQRNLNDNETVWFAHKLRNKIVHEEMSRLYKKEVQRALHGFRDALKDLGAL